MERINLYDYEREAREALSQMTWDYYASGAHDEITLRENHAAYDRIQLRYRVLCDVSADDPSTTVLGQDVAMPVLVAPTAFHRLAHPDGELATARAAGAAGTVMVVSTLATTAMEDIAAAASGPLWFQLYVYKDRAATHALVQRAEAAGCSALVLTVDAPRWGRRERDVRNRFHLPDGIAIENLAARGMGRLPEDVADSGLAAYAESLLDPTLAWKDLAWLCSITSLPVVIKGIVHPADARLAVEHGARGIVVSNHGGRQLDTAPATIEALPAVVEAVDGAIDVLVDGGVRRGTDVVKAVALGARAVLVGRPVLWGLAVDGQRGVEHVLSILRDEYRLALALCGCGTTSAITRDLVHGLPGPAGT